MKTTNILNYGAALIASLALMCACSSDDDDDKKEEQKTSSYNKETVAQAPEWHVDMNSNDQAPDWQWPDATHYENWALLMVTLEPELAKYASENDLMAVFVNDDLRALSYPSRTTSQQIVDSDGHVAFILKVFGNEMSGKIVEFTLKYYSTKLHQMFTLSGNEKFVAEEERTVCTPIDYGVFQVPRCYYIKHAYQRQRRVRHQANQRRPDCRLCRWCMQGDLLVQQQYGWR